jgi:hypothetical protein
MLGLVALPCSGLPTRGVEEPHVRLMALKIVEDVCIDEAHVVPH